MSALPDDNGLLLAQAGPSNIHVLYDRYAAVLYGAALRMSGSEAQAAAVLRTLFTAVQDPAQRYRPSDGRPLLWLLAKLHGAACAMLAEGPSDPAMIRAVAGAVHTASDRSLHLRLRCFNLPTAATGAEDKSPATSDARTNERRKELRAIKRALQR